MAIVGGGTVSARITSVCSSIGETSGRAGIIRVRSSFGLTAVLLMASSARTEPIAIVFRRDGGGASGIATVPPNFECGRCSSLIPTAA